MRITTLGDLLPIIRYQAFSRKDEGQKIMLCPECEEFTHVVMNVNSGFLDLLSKVIIDSIDADDDCVRIWIRTGEFDMPVLAKEVDNGT